MYRTKQDRRGVFGLIIAVSVVVLAGCGGGQGAAPETMQEGDSGDPPRVVATHSIVGDIVRNVGGEGLEMETMVGLAEDPHVFEPSPADSAALTEAAIVFENGLEFEPWIDDVYEASGAEARRVALSDGIEPLEADHADEHEDEHGEDHSHEHGDEGAGDEHTDEHSHEHGGEGHGDEDSHEDHAHGEYDPHVYFDPEHGVTMTENVRDALVEADPENADLYEENAAAYIAELQETDAWISEQVETIPEEDRQLVTVHEAFGYYADKYGFEVPGTALESFSTEAADPAAGDIAALSDEIQALGVPAIFPETTSNDAVMRQIADEAGVELAEPIDSDALGESGTAADTYIGMLRYNTTTIVGALGG